MGFSKAKNTFLESAGRRGAPSERKPFGKKNTKATARTNAAAMSKKTTRKPIGKAKVVKNGRPLATGKVKGKMNSYRTGKAVKAKTKSIPMSKAVVTKPKQDDIDARLGSYFSGIKGGY